MATRRPLRGRGSLRSPSPLSVHSLNRGFARWVIVVAARNAARQDVQRDALMPKKRCVQASVPLDRRVTSTGSSHNPRRASLGNCGI
jgi:hypothetical protein